MKIYKIILIVLLIFTSAVANISVTARAQSEGVAIEPISFTLIIVGTKHYQDADIMRRNIARIPLMQRFTPIVSSQNHIQFTGIFGGSREGLLSDIQGLAADRFELQSRDDKIRGLVITLRKIQAQ